jgi:hypothetical protein
MSIYLVTYFFTVVEFPFLKGYSLCLSYGWDLGSLIWVCLVAQLGFEVCSLLPLSSRVILFLFTLEHITWDMYCRGWTYCSYPLGNYIYFISTLLYLVPFLITSSLLIAPPSSFQSTILIFYPSSLLNITIIYFTFNTY